MKLPLLSLLSILAASLGAQNDIRLHLSQRLGAQPFALNTAATSPAGATFKVTRMEYYVSEIEILHDGGQTTPATDVYLLVDAATDSIYDLGAFPNVGTIEGVRFSIGVDQAHNHLDPASYPASHPLAPQNPSMHWGWASGYRFVAMEGKAGSNFTQIFELHTVDDANFRTLEIATAGVAVPGGQEIHLVADYTRVLKNINVASGPIVHGSTGMAVTVVNNMQNEVFSPAAVTGVTDPAFTGSFGIAPNPAPAGAIRASLALPVGADYRMTATDLAGRVVASQAVDAAQPAAVLNTTLQPGTYCVQLWQNGRAVATEKVVVIR